MFDFLSKKSLIINCTLFFDDNQHKLKILINIDVIEYVFIDQKITQFVCNMLNMKFISLLKSKSFIEFDDRHIFSIIHVIYFKLTIELHFELIASLLIIDLENHSIILKKSWINKHEIILNMTYDKLIFKSIKCNHHDNIFCESIKIKRLEIFESNRRWDVFNWRRNVVLFKMNNVEHIVTIEHQYIILFRSKVEFSTSIVENESNTSDSKHSSVSKDDCDNDTSTFNRNDFEIDTIVATKTSSCNTKRALKSQRNRKWKIKK